MITNLMLIQEIAKNKGNQLILIFIDLEKAFDSVNQGDIIELLAIRNVPLQIIKPFITIYEHNKTHLTINNENLGEIEIQKGVKQGASTSPLLFNMIIDELIRRLKNSDLDTRLTTYGWVHSLSRTTYCSSPNSKAKPTTCLQ